MVSHRRVASTSLLFLYSFATSLIVFLIKSIYYSFDEKEVFNFQKPGPLGFVLFIKCNVMSEWSFLKSGKMSALEVVDIKLALIEKKSRRHYISGFRLLQVKVFVSAFRKRQMSVRSKETTIYFTFCKDFSSLSIRRFWGKGERWERKRERAEGEKRLTQMLLLEPSTPTQYDSIPSNQNHSQSLGYQLHVSKSRGTQREYSSNHLNIALLNVF